MVVIWISNALRITALILIDVAGAPAVALAEFHSQAGWIAFNAVALSFSVAAGRLPWFAARPNAPSDSALSAENAVAAFLMPFLMTFGAAMISREVAGSMVWLYPILNPDCGSLSTLITEPGSIVRKMDLIPG